MKQRWLGPLALTLAVVVGAHSVLAQGREREPGGDDKVLTVGKDGLKVDGKIAENDPKVPFFIGDKKLGDLISKSYSVKLMAGKKYTITMDKTDMGSLDPFLILQDKAGKQLAFDDDSGGNLNAKLIFNAGKDDTYKVFAGSLTGATGDFALRIVEAEGLDPKKVHEVGAGGLTIQGALTPDAKSQTFQVKLVEGKTYQIDLKSRKFDAYLFLHDSTGNKLAEDDDGGDGLNSRIIHKAGSSGTYRIVASSLGMAGTGDFTLEVREKE